MAITEPEPTPEPENEPVHPGAEEEITPDDTEQNLDSEPELQQSE